MHSGLMMETLFKENSSQEPNAWVRERMQRNAASKFINEGDVAFIGDADEIINPDFIEYYAKMTKLYPNNIPFIT